MTISSKPTHGEMLRMAVRLRALRATTGLNQRAFAAAYGFGNVQWAMFENAAGRISIDAAILLARQFHVSLDWIYFGGSERIPVGLRDQIDDIIENMPLSSLVRLKQFSMHPNDTRDCASAEAAAA